jgi:RNA polymerase sigma factor (TIGR02999 family)
VSERFGRGDRLDDTTALLGLWCRGDRDAGERLLARLYPELRRLAVGQLRSAELSLQPSDLLHQAWLRLLAQRRLVWHNRAQFFALVATMVRRELVDQLRWRRRRKRDAAEGWQAPDVAPAAAVDYLALDQALERLAAIDPIAARVVELRHFGGLDLAQTAAALELSERTVKRRWRSARAFLRADLEARA